MGLNLEEIEARISENAKKNIFAPSLMLEMIAEIKQLRECIRSAPCIDEMKDEFIHGCTSEIPCKVCQWRRSSG